MSCGRRSRRHSPILCVIDGDYGRSEAEYLLDTKGLRITLNRAGIAPADPADSTSEIVEPRPVSGAAGGSTSLRQ